MYPTDISWFCPADLRDNMPSTTAHCNAFGSVFFAKY